jgi:hypothetical protein
MTRHLSLFAVAGLALLGLACGGESRPYAPSSVAALPAGPPPGTAVNAGTVLSVTVADTGEPALEATVRVGSHTYASDGSGRVVLEDGTTEGSPMEITAPGTLERQTLLRSSTPVLSLWPRTSTSGLDEEYTRQIVYTWDKNAGPGASPLYRLSGTQAVLVPSAALMGDSRVVAAHQHAANEVNAAAAGSVRYSVAAQAPPGAVVINTVLDPSDQGCKDRVLAFTSIRLRNTGEISSAKIVFCNEGSTRDGTVVHEVGHSFGMGHSPDPNEVMHAYKLQRQPLGFGARESLVMRLMLQRRGGNRFPDNDRGVTATGGERDVVIVCN